MWKRFGECSLLRTTGTFDSLLLHAHWRGGDADAATTTTRALATLARSADGPLVVER